MQKEDAEVVDGGAEGVVGGAGVLVLVVDDLLGDLVVGRAGLVHVLHLGLAKSANETIFSVNSWSNFIQILRPKKHLELRHEVERLVEVLLAQHLELDEVVVVLDLDEPAVGQVPQAVDARLAGELDRPVRWIEVCASWQRLGYQFYLEEK